MGLNYKDFVDYSKKDHPHEAQLLSLDISKASSNLIWRPRMNINETISMVVEWYKAYLDNPFESIEIMHSQINKYFNAIHKDSLLDNFASVQENKHILITGAAGMLGSSLAKELVNLKKLRSNIVISLLARNKNRHKPIKVSRTRF